MRKDLFLLLADRLDVIDKTCPEEFDMTDWRHYFPRGPHCRTVCCAIGHAAEIPEFIEAGLRIVMTGRYGYPKLVSDPDLYPDQVIAAVFDIPYNDAYRLFHRPFSVGARASRVAADLRAYVNGK